MQIIISSLNFKKAHSRQFETDLMRQFEGLNNWPSKSICCLSSSLLYCSLHTLKMHRLRLHDLLSTDTKYHFRVFGELKCLR